MSAENDDRGLSPSAERLRRLADELEAGGEDDLAALVRQAADGAEREGGPADEDAPE